jgi:hypothetical protein
LRTGSSAGVPGTIGCFGGPSAILLLAAIMLLMSDPRIIQNFEFLFRVVSRFSRGIPLSKVGKPSSQFDHG